MMEEKRILYLHVGLPKTGTTSIQEFLKEHHKAFEASGVGTLSVDGQGAHHLLAQHLICLDQPNKYLPGFFLGQDSLHINFFPTWGDLTKYIISAEDLAWIGSQGANELRTYADANKASLRVVCVLRNPIDWLWSIWNQECKYSAVDWVNFIESAALEKRGFLGNIFSGISLLSELDSMIFIEYQPKKMIENFLDRLSMTHIYDFSKDYGKSNTNQFNVSKNVIESMYTSALSREVHMALSETDNFLYANLPSGFVQRNLLDLADKASPVFELSQKYADKVLKMPSIFGADSHEAINSYLEGWLSDANSFLEGASCNFQTDSLSVFKSLVDKVILDLSRLKDGLQLDKTFPQRNFLNNLPINSEFIGMARSIALLIYLGYKK